MITQPPKTNLPSGSFRQKSQRVVAFLLPRACFGKLFWQNRLAWLLPPVGDNFQIFFRAGKMHIFFPNPEPPFLVADWLMTDFADPVAYDPCFHEANWRTFHCKPRFQEKVHHSRIFPVPVTGLLSHPPTGQNRSQSVFRYYRV